MCMCVCAHICVITVCHACVPANERSSLGEREGETHTRTNIVILNTDIFYYPYNIVQGAGQGTIY